MNQARNDTTGSGARRLLYVSLARTPTEKAHGLQIAQNCEAFAAAGCEVALWGARRVNTPELRGVRDIHAFYGVEKTFSIRRLPMLDLMPLAFGQPRLERIAFYIGMVTYTLVLLLRVIWRDDDVYYSRDEYLLYALSWVKPRRKLIYEAHLFSPTKRGGRLQAAVMRRCGLTVAITPPLRADLIAERGADPDRVIVAHDGVRAARFAQMPSQAAARQALGWPPDALIVGFVGRLHMLNVDKGAGLLVEALAELPGVTLALVGGPDDMALALRDRWQALGLPPERFLYPGHVPAADVPLHLAAFDICAMPHPHTRQFAYYTSPLKLFEYMAAGRAIIASDLPGWADVVTHDETALLVEAGDVGAWTAALRRLADDPALRERLGAAARQRAMALYTWDARAAHILGAMRDER